MKTQICIEAVDVHGVRAIITAETNEDWAAFNADVDVSFFNLADVRRVTFSNDQGRHQWLNSGECVGWKT